MHTCTRPIDKITREDVAGFQIYLTNSDLAAATIRGYMVTLKTFLSWSVEREYLRANPGDGVKLPSRKKPQVEWLEPDKVKELAKAIKGSALEGPVNKKNYSLIVSNNTDGTKYVKSLVWVISNFMICVRPLALSSLRTVFPLLSYRDCLNILQQI